MSAESDQKDRTEQAMSRIRALFAKADSTQFPEEAKSLREAAHRQMAKYSIEWAAIDYQNQNYTTAPASMKVKLYAPYIKEYGSMLSQIGFVFNCRITYPSRGSGEVEYEIHGYQSDIDIVWTLFVNIFPQCNLALAAQSSGMSAVDKRSFIRFYGHTVAERMEEFYKAEVEDSAPGTALVLVSREENVVKYLNDLYPNIRMTKRKASTSYYGAMLGKEEGAKADIALDSRRIDEETAPAQPIGALN